MATCWAAMPPPCPLAAGDEDATIWLRGGDGGGVVGTETIGGKGALFTGLTSHCGVDAAFRASGGSGLAIDPRSRSVSGYSPATLSGKTVRCSTSAATRGGGGGAG